MIYLNTLPAVWPAVLGCDTETTSLDPFKGKILSIQFSDGHDSWVFLHSHGFKKVLPVLQDPSVLKIFHYAKFDVKFITHHLHIPVNNVYCTMLAEQVIDGGRSGRDVHNDLKDVLARRLGILLDKEPQKTFVDHPGFKVRPVTTEQINYMANDVLYLPALREAQLVELKNDGQLKAAQLEFDCVQGFAELELGGMRLDIDLWFKDVQWYTDKIEECNKRFLTILGDFTLKIPKTKIRSKNKQKYKENYIKEVPAPDINFGSSDQMKLMFLQRFGINLPNTDAKKTLLPILNGEMLADVITPDAMEFIKTLMEQRTWEKYLAWNFPKHINSVTGKIHPKFNQIGADTGRVSCSAPGMHQIPRPVFDDQGNYAEPNLRHVFLPDDDDMVLVRVDYNQQEPRIFAHMCGDPALIKACNEKDVYIAQARLLYGREVDKNSEERQITKSFALAVLYGAGVETLHKSSRRPIEDCTRIRNVIKQSFPVAAAYANKMENFVRKNQYVLTALGRRRYIPNNKRQYAQSVNAPIQGTGADLFKLAFKNLHKRLTEEKKCGNINGKTRPWHVIHDEIVVQCHKDEVDKVIPIIKQIMEDAGRELCPTVLHIAEAKCSRTWDK